MAIDDAAVREQLLSRLEELTGRGAAIARHLRGQDGRHDADFGDVANYTAGDEVLEGLDEATRAQAARIHEALRRLDDGTYGVCVVCGEPIPEARLAALPDTPFCADDAP